jgi:2-keto-4-pentenoate hydratase
MGTDSVELAAARLRDAETSRIPCLPVRDLLGSTDIAAAYVVQLRNRDLRFAAGARLVGRKIGVTSEAVQTQLAVHQPDSGSLLDDMATQGGVVPAGRLMQPRVEGEIAFWLGNDMPDEVQSIDQVAAVIDSAVAAIEIVDSRIQNWDISIVDTVADNASSGMFAVSERRVPLTELDVRSVNMTMTRGGEVVSSGTGAACLGHPLNAVLWLAQASAALGTPLRAGELILSGALGPLVPAFEGDEIRAEFTDLGAVDVHFDRGESSW